MQTLPHISTFNIQELRANIGDNPIVEKSLLFMFIESSQESLALLEENLLAREDASYNQLWKSHMHQIKGAASNIYATTLTQVAAIAHENYDAQPSFKKALLATVLREFDAVKTQIEQMYAL